MRPHGTHRLASDIDLAIFGDELTVRDSARLLSQIEDAPLPIDVDFVIYHKISNEALRREIDLRGVDFWRRGENLEKTFDFES